MRDGFIKVAAATPKLKVADVSFNKEKTISLIKKAIDEQVKLLVLPELTLTCYTSADLFFHPFYKQDKHTLLGHQIIAPDKHCHNY